MTLSIPLTLVMATYGAPSESDTPAHLGRSFDDLCTASEGQLRALVNAFRSEPVTPTRTLQFEQDVQAALRELGRHVVHYTYNHVEPAAVADQPTHAQFECERYTRVHTKTPQNVWTVFGQIVVRRVGYRPSQAGEPMIFPLAHRFGLVHGASPALAARACQLLAEAGTNQQRVLDRLRTDHGVGWGVKKLRQVSQAVSDEMAEYRHDAQVEQLLTWLAAAGESTGRHKPVVCVGRDGITLRLRAKRGSLYEVASTGTISVYDRRARRLGTVYLAYTPESGQPTMSRALTAVIRDVLTRWDGPVPRWCYVTDAGDNETGYYDDALQGMTHPRTRQVVEWVRVVDYYHASERVWTLANALFGGDREAAGWAKKMLKWMLQPGGVNRVLHSAAAFRVARTLPRVQRTEYDRAYAYLRNRMGHMDYARYRRVGVPLGSGVTEAACKTVFTQRLKLSGMRWTKDGAQTVLNLRVILLSGIWEVVYQRVLAARPQPTVGGYGASEPNEIGIAA
ncbi:hypothetical protein [Fimbriiglobus ruber]|uniref:ISKra4 family transposase n=1 Tax=Fimbriiglobus ruber TaxID=1908690 RepID=A0A225DXN3_9BACT|nr:hypothetical protein [Fimbriiglobus ruber]OWK41989.1 hypothetical protein FRUB_04067 [Fimbriiglobus ruber]